MTTARSAPERAATGPRRRSGVLSTAGAVITGAAAAYGLAVCGGLLAVIFDGVEQWASPPAWLDDTAPFVFIVGALALAGRVARDVADRWAPGCAVGAGLLTLGSGWAVSLSTEAHGDGLELHTVVIAAAVVTVAVAMASALTALLRGRRDRRSDASE